MRVLDNVHRVSTDQYLVRHLSPHALIVLRMVPRHLKAHRFASERCLDGRKVRVVRVVPRSVKNHFVRLGRVQPLA